MNHPTPQEPPLQSATLKRTSFLMRGLVQAFALFALLTSAAASPGQQTDRMKQVWEGIYNRMTHQSDQWYEDGDFPRCIQNLKMMHQLFPDDYEAATNLGWMLENVHEWDAALSVYVDFRKHNSKSPDAAWPEANYHYMKKNFAKVPAILEPTLAATPAPHPNTYRTLAHSYEKLGRFKDAARVWEALLKITPDDEAAKVNLKKMRDRIGSDG